MVKRMLILFSIIFYMDHLFAQADTTVKLLSEIVVTPLRNKQKEQKIPYVISTITRNELNQFSPRTTPEALMGITGIFVQKTNHGGGSAFIRGLTGNQTLMLIDGIRLNNSTFRYGPNQYLNTIDQFTIQRIEVAKGTGSVQYGSDALGGVIQVFTKEPVYQSTEKSKRFGGMVSSKFMSGNMEKTLRPELNYSGNKFAATGGFTVRNFGDIIGGNTTGKQATSGYKEFAFDIKLKFKLKSNLELIAAHQFLRQQKVPVYHKIKLENFLINEMDPQQRMLNYAKLRIKNKTRWIQTVELTTSHQQTTEVRNSQKNGATILRTEKDQVSTLGFSLDVSSSILKNWTANSGVDLYQDKINSTRNDINTTNRTISSKRGLYPNQSVYNSYSFFSLHQFQLHAFQINAGIRFNTFKIHIKDTTIGTIKINPTAWVGNLALQYSFTERNHLFVSFNNSYRAPNIDDMGTLGIVDFRYELPAYDLQPERSFNYEAGYKYRGKKINFTSSVFYMQLQNLITRIRSGNEQINGYNVYIKENTDKAFIKGIETEAEVQFAKNWNVKAGASYLYGQSKTRNEPLRRIPPFNGNVRTTYYWQKWFAAAEILFASKQNRLAQGDKEDNRIPTGGTPGFNVFNLYAGCKLKQLQLQTGIQNIFNKDYRTHGSGINGYGRSVWVHIQFMF